MSRDKGSQRCMLEWLGDGNFLAEINDLLSSANASISPTDKRAPTGFSSKGESGLSTFLAEHPNIELGTEIKKWWATGKKPTWDFLSSCIINGKAGILLVEAKAHEEELNKESKGKEIVKDPSEGSDKNHTKIGEAIKEANTAIAKQVAGIKISRDKCYQLSNRIAHAWWLANQGIPVVLLYLGFRNVTDMPVKKTFKTAEDWKAFFTEHAKQVGADNILDKQIDCGDSNLMLICKSIEDPKSKNR